MICSDPVRAVTWDCLCCSCPSSLRAGANAAGAATHLGAPYFPPQAGIIGVEALGYGNWLDAAEWPVSGAPITYFGNAVPFDLATLTAIEFVSLAFVESARGAETDAMKVRRGGRCVKRSPHVFATALTPPEDARAHPAFRPPSPQRIYPGGAFDPLGFSKDAKTFEENKLKEIKNGRCVALRCPARAGAVLSHWLANVRSVSLTRAPFLPRALAALPCSPCSATGVRLRPPASRRSPTSPTTSRTRSTSPWSSTRSPSRSCKRSAFFLRSGRGEFGGCSAGR